MIPMGFTTATELCVFVARRCHCRTDHVHRTAMPAARTSS
jgi:hypothetical protein